jgi:hypothetical protein
VLRFGGALEKNYTAEDKMKKILDMARPDFSGTDLDNAQKALGIGGSEIAGMRKFSDKAFDAFGKAIVAHRTTEDAKAGGGEIQIPAGLIADALQGLSGPEEKAARQLLKTMSLKSFEGMDAEQITTTIRGMVKNANNSISSAQYDFTASNIWHINQGDAGTLKKALMGNASDISEALGKIDTTQSPGLRELRSATGEIGKIVGKFGSSTYASLSAQEKSEVASKFGIDIADKDKGKTIKELGELAVKNAVSLAQGGATDAFNNDAKSIESTMVRVDGKNAIAVVVMKPASDQVIDLNAYLRDGGGMPKINLDGTNVGQAPGSQPPGSTETGNGNYSNPASGKPRHWDGNKWV